MKAEALHWNTFCTLHICTVCVDTKYLLNNLIHVCCFLSMSACWCCDGHAAPPVERQQRLKCATEYLLIETWVCTNAVLVCLKCCVHWRKCVYSPVSLFSMCAGKRLPQVTEPIFIVPGAAKWELVWGVLRPGVFYKGKCNGVTVCVLLIVECRLGL